MKTMYCSNCGKNGHLYKTCLLPIISLGIILVKKPENKLMYLLIQRKDTLGFVEFLRGKYNLDNIDYIKQLISIMTEKERKNIVQYDFDKLWNCLWMNQNNKKYFNEYEISKKKFYILKQGYRYNNILIKLVELEQAIDILYLNPEWGFPKGRRNLYESDFDCAKREFEEETSIKSEDYKILNMDTYVETFFGSNNIKYKHIYYIATINNNKLKIGLDMNNENQISEISNIQWFTFEDAYNIIRPYNQEKKKIFKKINDKLTKIL